MRNSPAPFAPPGRVTRADLLALAKGYPKDTLKTALHESAHAAAAIAYGYREVLTRLDGEHGRTQYLDPPGPVNYAELLEDAIIGQAGVVAEQVIQRKPRAYIPPEAESDQHGARANTRLYAEEIMRDSRAPLRAQFAALHPLQRDIEDGRLCAEANKLARCIAETLVARYWHLIAMMGFVAMRDHQAPYGVFWEAKRLVWVEDCLWAANLQRHETSTAWKLPAWLRHSASQEVNNRYFQQSLGLRARIARCSR